VQVVEVAEHVVQLGLVLWLRFFIDELLKICNAKRNYLFHKVKMSAVDGHGEGRVQPLVLRSEIDSLHAAKQLHKVVQALNTASLSSIMEQRLPIHILLINTEGVARIFGIQQLVEAMAQGLKLVVLTPSVFGDEQIVERAPSLHV
jgi:hypothetical protein